MSDIRGALLRWFAVSLCSSCALIGAPPAQPQAGQAWSLVDAEFTIHALGDRCLDYGGDQGWARGSPVVIERCNGTASQKVRVREVDDGSHDIELLTGDALCIGARLLNGEVSAGGSLELQACIQSPAQRFAFDGDAILIGRQRTGRVTRELVIEPQLDVTLRRTPLVVGTRELVDAEYFRFRPVLGGDARPHSGFVRVSSEAELDGELNSATWGKVIEIDDREPIRLEGSASKSIPEGVTLRGYRKFNLPGPELFRCSSSPQPAFALTEEDVRLTGFRLRGPAQDAARCPWYRQPRNSAGNAAWVNAIQVSPHAEETVPRVIIDHLELGYFNGSGIDVKGPGPGPAFDGPNPDDDYLTDCPNPPLVYPRETRVRAVGNALHYLNPYGVVTTNAFVLADGNVFYEIHNHAIASSGAKTSGYVAYHNLTLSPSGSHDFDVHGSLHEHHWYGGIAGDYYDIGWNAFLHVRDKYEDKDRVNFDIRGTPCHRVDLHDNVFRRSPAESFNHVESLDPVHRFKVWGGKFGDWAPMNELAVGDFDGDGVDDLFAGTGAAWYFSSGGQTEWRFLNRMPEKASELRFGDFDGDGRTDVVAVHGGRTVISWAGGSLWQSVNAPAPAISDLAVGDFDGDGAADLFLADGTTWFVARQARGWEPYSTRPSRTSELLFGDFTGDSRTDVVVTTGLHWQLVTKDGGSEHTIDLDPSLSGPLTGVVVADFTGDRKADLARSSGGSWWLSDGGMTSWSALRSATVPGYGEIVDLRGYPLGRFVDGGAVADIAFPSGATGVHFDYAPGGRDPIRRMSWQAMR